MSCRMPGRSQSALRVTRLMRKKIFFYPAISRSSEIRLKVLPARVAATSQFHLAGRGGLAGALAHIFASFFPFATSAFSVASL